MAAGLLPMVQPAGLAVSPAVCSRALRTAASLKNATIGLHSSQYKKVRMVSVSAIPDVLTNIHPVIAAVEIDWTDPDVQIGALGAFLGLALGIGTPLFYISRDRRDEERLEELRALNRATKQETGEYLSPEEIEAIRPPRWTDRREFVDDD